MRSLIRSRLAEVSSVRAALSKDVTKTHAAGAPGASQENVVALQRQCCNTKVIVELVGGRRVYGWILIPCYGELNCKYS